MLGFDDVDGYLANENFGSSVGRTTGKIANAQFKLDDVYYPLSVNDGLHHSNGGGEGFGSKNWAASIHDDGASVVFSLSSPSGDQGYPGDLMVSAKFTLSSDSGLLSVEYLAMGSRRSPVNLSQRFFLNLAGHDKGI